MAGWAPEPVQTCWWEYILQSWIFQAEFISPLQPLLPSNQCCLSLVSPVNMLHFVRNAVWTLASVSAKLLYMFRASIVPIIRSTSNCSCSLWYGPYYLMSKFPQTWSNLVTFEEACSPDSMIYTRGCNYSFMYAWWWVRWMPETCRVI